jgi:hypothetical protein
MPWLRWLVTGLSLRRPRSVHMGFVVDEVALGQVFLWDHLLSPVNIIPPWLSILIFFPGGWTIGPLVAAVQGHSFTPSIWTTRSRYRVPWKKVFSNTDSGRLGGVVVSEIATGRPKGRGFEPGQGDGFLRAIKIRNTYSFRCEIKL